MIVVSPDLGASVTGLVTASDPDNNLFLGGVVGVAFVAFDFYVRSQVLANSHLFHR